MNQLDLQNKLDIEKWLDSETKRKDQCGKYVYCAYCENESEYPCANAYLRYRDAETPKQKTEPEAEAAATLAPAARKPALTFAERLEHAPAEIKAAYAEIVAALSAEKKIHGRLTKSAHNFTVKRVPVAKIRMLKKSMNVYLALDPAAERYQKYPHKDVSEKKSYARIPFVFKVSSPLSIRRAKQLIEDLLSTLD